MLQHSSGRLHIEHSWFAQGTYPWFNIRAQFYLHLGGGFSGGYVPPGGLSFSLRIASWKTDLPTAWCNFKEPSTRNCNAALPNLYGNTSKSFQVQGKIEYHRNKDHMDWKTCVCLCTSKNTFAKHPLLCNVLQLHAGPRANAMALRGPISGSHLRIATDPENISWTFHEWKCITHGNK